MVTRFLAALGGVLMSAATAGAADLPAPTRAAAPLAEAGIPSFYVHVGAAGLLYDVSAKVRTYNVPIPGATVSIKDAVTGAVELGYFLTPNIAVSGTGGFPPTSKVVAAGTLAGLGTVGKTMGGPAALTVHYHFDGFGPLQPYVGGGVAMLFIINDQDGLLTRLNTRNAVGPVVQGGFDYMISQNLGVFFDVKKGFLTAHTSGYLGPDYIRSKVTLDPLVLHSGLTIRF